MKILILTAITVLSSMAFATDLCFDNVSDQVKFEIGKMSGAKDVELKDVELVFKAGNVAIYKVSTNLMSITDAAFTGDWLVSVQLPSKTEMSVMECTLTAIEVEQVSNLTK